MSQYLGVLEHRDGDLHDLGEICTRSCGFCAVTFGRPTELDLAEPDHLAEAVAALGLGHVVVTSVNRDELENGGAEIFAASIRKIRERSTHCTVEVLIPDFQGKKSALDLVLEARPEILAHNTETVPVSIPMFVPKRSTTAPCRCWPGRRRPAS